MTRERAEEQKEFHVDQAAEEFTEMVGSSSLLMLIE